jgi:hypothetical protein
MLPGQEAVCWAPSGSGDKSMMKSHEMETGVGFDSPPFLYEIRVRGRLSSEQWVEWFDDLIVTSNEGESTMRGRAIDHSALYGLLARLQDLAVPLVSVKVLDADAQLELTRQSRRNDLAISALLGLIYLTLLGGLATLTIFLAPIINPALALALLFALLGGLAHAFWLWRDQPMWRWITYVAWPAAFVSFLIFIPVSGVLPTAVALAVVFFFVAGALVYILYLLRRHAQDIKQRIAGGELPFEDGEEDAVERNSPSTG